MKIANLKHIAALALGFVGAFYLTSVHGVRAQTTVAEIAASSAATTVSVAGSVTPPAIPVAATAPGGNVNLAHPPAGPGIAEPVALKPGSEVPKVVPLPDVAPIAEGEEEDPFEDRRTPKQVRKLVKKLENDKVDLSLDDMNQARAALARLDLLLALEQKLGDLDKVRAKREGGDMADEVSSMLPPGVARMPGSRITKASLAMPSPNFMAQSAPPAPVAPPVVEYSVQQIEGVNGVYRAVLSGGGDQKSIVHVGDKLSNGAEVKGITTTSVQLRMPGENSDRTIKINNAGAVNSGRRMP